MLRKIINKSNYLHIASVYIRDLLGRSCYIKYDDKYVDEIKINGFVVLPIKLDKNICDNIINMIDSNLDKSKIFDSDFRIWDASKYSECINNHFTKNNDCLDYAISYLRKPVINQGTLAAKLTFKSGNKGSGQGWHRDSYSRQIKAIAYLSDVDESTGPFEYIAGSHTYSFMFKEGSYKKHKKLSPHEYRLSDDYIDSLTNDFNLESKLITGSAGTIILSDTRGIHRGHPIKNSNRYALTNYYIQESHFNPDKAI